MRQGRRLPQFLTTSLGCPNWHTFVALSPECVLGLFQGYTFFSPRILPRDLPWGWTVMSGRACGTVWARGQDSGHIQCFGILPLNTYSILINQQNTWSMVSAWQFLKETMCWNPVHVYWVLFKVIQCPQEEEVFGPKDSPVVTVATKIPAACAATAPENQLVLVSVTPTQKETYIRKLVCLMRDGNEPGLSWELEEDPEVITQSLPLRKLWDMQKDFGHQTNTLSASFLWCWDKRVSSLEGSFLSSVKGKELHQGRCYASPRQVDHHGNRYAVLEVISFMRGGL